MKATAFQAYAKGASRTANTPRQAAIDFFNAFPTKRKCDIVQGEADGHFFTVSYGNRFAGGMPQSWKDVTKKTADTLPDCPIRANQ